MSGRRTTIALWGALVLLGVAGCFNPFSPRIASDRGISEPSPVPDTPRNLMRLFEWCWENRAISEYREIFTEDYRFAFAAADSAGNAFQDRALTRDDELESATNLFVGGSATEPPASRITLALDPNIVALPDSRPGKTDPWHKEISTTVDLTISAGAIEFRVVGRGRFFVVRGDSALIPQELKDRGDPFGPNPNRWYIERWEDETGGNLMITPVEALDAPNVTGAADGAIEPTRRRGAARALQTAIEQQATWGYIKALFFGDRRASSP